LISSGSMYLPCRCRPKCRCGVSPSQVETTATTQPSARDSSAAAFPMLLGNDSSLPGTTTRAASPSRIGGQERGAPLDVPHHVSRSDGYDRREHERGTTITPDVSEHHALRPVFELRRRDVPLGQLAAAPGLGAGGARAWSDDEAPASHAWRSADTRARAAWAS
jgi:hypothetical protein